MTDFLFLGSQITADGDCSHESKRHLLRQGCPLSPCLFNLYTRHIMRNVRLHELQAGIKIGGRNINTTRYTDDTTLMAESKELKSLLMKVKEESEKDSPLSIRIPS